MINFAEAVAHLNFELVGRSENLRSFNRATKWRRIHCHNFFVTQAVSQAPRLFAAIIRKSNVGRASKAILSADHSRAVSDHEDSRDRRLH